MLIVLDLNGVLLHRESRGKKKYYADDMGVIAGRRTYIRQHANSFISNLFEKHDVAIWSTAKYENVMAMIDLIGIDKSLFLFIWSNSECISTNNLDEKNKPLLIKPLSYVWDEFNQYNKFNTVIIDDSYLKIKMNPRSCVFVPPSFNNPDINDNALSVDGEFNYILEKMSKQ